MGLIVRFPLGGMAWHYLQYVMGLRRLGHDVLYIEDSDDFPGCYDPLRFTTDSDPSYGLRFTHATFKRLGLDKDWAYWDAHGGEWRGGLGEKRREAIFDDVDMLINVSLSNPIRDWALKVPLRLAIDTDPVFTQIRNLSHPARREATSRHTHFFTFGERWGAPGSTMPDDGFGWLPTRQPIVLEAWPTTEPPRGGRFTTVMQWDSYPSRVYNGVRYETKARSFEKVMGLPTMVTAELELALGGTNAPRQRLLEHGWRLENPLGITRDPWTFRSYVRSSAGEFSVCKHGYVTSRCGWFSERSANYLASGRPVIVEETGFSDWLPTGLGVLPFSTAEEAAQAVETVRGDLSVHGRAARDLAQEYFDAGRVLGDLTEAALGGQGNAVKSEGG